MLEKLSGRNGEDGVAFEGFGGVVNVAKSAPYWDWNMHAALQASARGIEGTANMLAKDGRTVLRTCSVASANDSGPIATASPALAEPSAQTRKQALSPAESDLKRREEELDKREKALADRERTVGATGSINASAATAAPTPLGVGRSPAPNSPTTGLPTGAQASTTEGTTLATQLVGTVAGVVQLATNARAALANGSVPIPDPLASVRSSSGVGGTASLQPAGIEGPCREEFKKRFDVLGVAPGDVNCSPQLLSAVVPGHVFKLMPTVRPQEFGPRRASLATHLANAMAYVGSKSWGESITVRDSANLGGLQESLGRMSELTISFAFRARKAEVPTVTVYAVTRRFCSQNGIESSLKEALVKKYGEPTAVTSNTAMLAAMRTNLESHRRKLAKEDPRTQMLYRNDLVLRIEAVAQMERLTKAAPGGPARLEWVTAEGNGLQVDLDDTCDGGAPQVRMVSGMVENAALYQKLRGPASDSALPASGEPDNGDEPKTYGTVVL